MTICPFCPFVCYLVKPDGTHEITDNLAVIGTSNSELQQMVNAFHDAYMKWV